MLEHHPSHRMTRAIRIAMIGPLAFGFAGVAVAPVAGAAVRGPLGGFTIICYCGGGGGDFGDAGGYDAGGYDAGGYDPGGYDPGGYDAGGYDAGDVGGDVGGDAVDGSGGDAVDNSGGDAVDNSGGDISDSSGDLSDGDQTDESNDATGSDVGDDELPPDDEVPPSATQAPTASQPPPTQAPTQAPTPTAAPTAAPTQAPTQAATPTAAAQTVTITGTREPTSVSVVIGNVIDSWGNWRYYSIPRTPWVQPWYGGPDRFRTTRTLPPDGKGQGEAIREDLRRNGYRLVSRTVSSNGSTQEVWELITTETGASSDPVRVQVRVRLSEDADGNATTQQRTDQISTNLPLNADRLYQDNNSYSDAYEELNRDRSPGRQPNRRQILP